MTSPISPGEVVKLQEELIPDFVIEAFNEEIAKNWNGKCSRVKQKDLLERMLTKKLGPDYSQEERMNLRHQIFENNWLDVEPIFRAEGWKVGYDKPGYCETYDAAFEFSISRQ